MLKSELNISFEKCENFRTIVPFFENYRYKLSEVL